MRDDLLDLVLSRDELADLDPAARRLALRELLPTPEIAAELADAIDGYGPLTEVMEDDDITDVLVNGPGEVWVERRGRLERTTIRFDGDELRRYAARWLSSSGGRADAANPMADARLPGGARVHVVLPPVAREGPLVSIRKFPSSPFDLDALARTGMVDDDQDRLLRELVAARRSIAVTGGTGTGKTTLLGALIALVPSDERVVVIEESRELRPAGGHHVSLVARPPNVEGRGAISLDSLVRNALRMRPDRIVVGEVRGPEALTALDAMVAGHEGSMLTLHARRPEEASDRLVGLALGAGSGAPEAALRERVRYSIDAFVHLERCDGRRRIAEIVERR